MPTIMKQALLLLLVAPPLFAQSFTAETGTLFLGDEPTVRSGNVKVLSGVLKKNDKVDIYAETGRKFTAIVTEISGAGNQPVNEAKPNQFAFVTLRFTEDPSKGSDYVREGYKVYPMGFKVNTGALKADAEAKLAKSVQFKARLDGKTFRGKVTHKGATLWRKGVKNLVEKPYLQLQFACVDEPDTRTLTIQVFHPKEAPATYRAKDLEVNFSGAADGNANSTTLYGFVNGKGDTDFTLEITKWQAVSSGKALLSGTVSGDLKEVKLIGKSARSNRFETGVFENIEVELFNTQPDFKDLMKSAGGGVPKN